MSNRLTFSLITLLALGLIFTNSVFADTAVPSAPTGLSASAVSPTKVNLFWTAPSGFTVTGYKIDYKAGNSNYATLVTTSTADTSYAHTGLTTGTAYSYKVYAINSIGTSLASSEITITPTSSSVGALPGSPTNLVATPYSTTQSSLSWTAPSSNGGYPITGYRIEYRVGGGTYNDLTPNTGNSATTYSHTGLTAGQIYVYRVYAITSFGASANPSVETLLKMPSSANPPSAPTLLSATAISPTQVNLSWNAPSNTGFQITGYKIDVKKSSASYTTLVANTGNTTTTYHHTALVTGTTYSYKVYAINSIGPSPASPEASATPTASSTSAVPSSPTGLSATPASGTQINLSWSAPSNNGGSAITGYKIEYKVGSAAYSVLVANTGNTATNYSHTLLTTGQTYVYRVSAINSIGASNPSSEISATPTASSTASTTKSVPGAPTGLVATPVSGSQVNLSWSAPANNGGSAITGYKIESKKGGDSYSVLVQNTGSVITTYSHIGVITSNVYYYRVSAINSIGTSSPSGEASATPKDTDRPTLTATATSPTSVYLSWTTPSQTYHQSISGFKVEEKQGTSYKVIKDNVGPVSGYEVTNVVTGKSHTYVASAVFSVGASPRSNEATVTPTSTSVTPPGFSTTPTPIQTTSANNDPNAILKSQQDEMQRKAQEAMDAMIKQSGKVDSDKAKAAREAAQKANDLANKNATDAIKKRVAESQAKKKMPTTVPTPTTSAKLANSTKSKPRTVEEARQIAEELKQKALAQQDTKDTSKQKEDQRDKALKAMEAEKAAVWEKAKKALEAAKATPKK